MAAAVGVPELPSLPEDPKLKLHSAVDVVGLQSKPELNGQRATIIGWDGGKGRHPCEMVVDGTRLLLKPSNLQSVDVQPQPLEGSTKLAEWAVENGDTDFGLCQICQVRRLELTSTVFMCCWQSVCGPCAVEHMDHAKRSELCCPFCRGSLPAKRAFAREQCKRHCALGDPRAFFSMPAIIAAGPKASVLTVEQWSYYSALAARGYSQAMYTCAHELWDRGYIAAGTRMMRSAVGTGLASAPRAIGDRHELGADGFERSLALAIPWFQLAADRGDGTALAKLGSFHYNGVGVAQDVAEGARLYRAAAEAGNAQAMYLYADCCGNGRGVEKDTQACVYWWRSAAGAGHAQAAQMLRANGLSLQQPDDQLDHRKKQAFSERMRVLEREHERRASAEAGSVAAMSEENASARPWYLQDDQAPPNAPPAAAETVGGASDGSSSADRRRGRVLFLTAALVAAVAAAVVAAAIAMRGSDVPGLAVLLTVLCGSYIALKRLLAAVVRVRKAAEAEAVSARIDA